MAYIELRKLRGAPVRLFAHVYAVGVDVALLGANILDIACGNGRGRGRFIDAERDVFLGDVPLLIPGLDPVPFRILAGDLELRSDRQRIELFGLP